VEKTKQQLWFSVFVNNCFFIELKALMSLRSLSAVSFYDCKD
jgi:hypothetical protein